MDTNNSAETTYGTPCQVPGCHFLAESPQLLLLHYGMSHKKDPRFQSLCLAEGCEHGVFVSQNTLEKHIRNYHREFRTKRSRIEAANTADVQESVAGPSQDDIISPISLVDDHVDAPDVADTMDSAEAPNIESFEALDKEAASYILKLFAERKLTETDVNFVVKSTNDLTKIVCKRKYAEISALLRQQYPQIADEVIGMFEEEIEVFPGLGTTYLQNKYFEKNFGMILPEKVLLPLRPEDLGRKGFKRLSYTYIPLAKQTEALLNLPDVRKSIFTDHQFECLLASFKDGEAFKLSSFFQQHPDALQFHIYLDEVQLCNPLGSKTHKLVFVYFAIGNLHAKNRSSLRNIHLLSIFYDDDVASHGFNHLLRIIVDDLKKFEHGIEMTINGGRKKIYGTLTALIADNLASHNVGGLKAAFGTGFRKCRFCLATDEEFQTKFLDSDFIPRTAESHKLHCAGLKTDLYEYFSKIYGVHFQSILDELNFFNVIGGLVPDLMHDLLEGSIPLTICLILKYCITEKKYFSIDDLNHAINNFPYGHSEMADKPSPITMKHIEKPKLRQSAAQIWLLAVSLPLLIGSTIPLTDEKWQCYLMLLQISRIVFRKNFTNEILEKLDELVYKFCISFKSCFKEQNITPKIHHLIHYSRQIKLLGPLINYWCMRYEAKHSYFKQLYHSIKNSINLPFTLAKRHQQWQCHNLREYATQFLTEIIECPSKSVDRTISQFDSCVELSQIFGISLNDSVKSVPWVNIGNLKFSCNGSFIVYSVSQGIPSFGKINEIFVKDRQVVFKCKFFLTESFESHYQCYTIIEENRSCFFNYDQLPDHRNYHVHQVFNTISKGVVNDPKNYVFCKSDL